MTVPTKGDPGNVGWAIRDRVVRLRAFGTDRVFDLDQAQYVIGSALDATIRIDDPGVSRRHADLIATDDGWTISDLGSTNGIRRDGEEVKTFTLAPAVEIGFARTAVLIAESSQSVVLRAFLQRLLGWASEAQNGVDDAIRAIRQMSHLRAILVLRGDGALDGVGRLIHGLTLGADRPFSVCARDESGVAALHRACDGTLFLDGEELPHDIEQVVVNLRLPENCTRLIVRVVTDDAMSEVASLSPHVAQVWVPALGGRTHDMDRVLLQYAEDAARKGRVDTALRPHDLKWVREGGVPTHARAIEVMRRVVLARNWGITGAAEREGITPGAMTRYLQRAGIPS